MSVLITGGSGSLGRELPYSHKPKSSELNLLSYEELANYIRQHNISKIVHCAAVTGTKDVHAARPCDILVDNSIMNANVLRACAEFSLQDSIFVSSICVFPSHGHIIDESSVFEGSPSVFHREYAMSKRMLMMGLTALKVQYGINTRCLIPCNFTTSGLIRIIAEQFQNRQQFFPFFQTDRKYLMDVSDFVRVILEADNRETFPSVMTVAPPNAVMMGELVNGVAESLGRTLDGVVYSQSVQQQFSPISTALFQKTFPDFSWKTIKTIINGVLCKHD